MNITDFDAALAGLGWKVSDFCRQAGLHRNTPSRWRSHGVAIPLWVDKFLGMALEVKRLHDRFIVPPKDSDEPKTDA
ncbi:hypothetical protein [Polaromonas sp.]|uniref:hypothetical protein n=1 Tax=Polaromonas sp. TaxID=1869339 RepID=UPI00248A3287|nr:hypothetical protein [Polaromonas sp.]MDI1339363.1 hypothetical protein [Polaromonas sp.]